MGLSAEAAERSFEGTTRLIQALASNLNDITGLLASVADRPLD